MVDLIVSVLGLLLGPAAFRLSRLREEIYGFLDGFVLVGVAWLLIAEVMPDTVRSAGWTALLFAVAGFVLPFLLERRLALLPFSPNAFFRWLMIAGLLLHQLLDGVMLSRPLASLDPTSAGGVGPIQLAVILHQIPKGFFIWGMVAPALGVSTALTVIGGLCAASVGGFFLGERLSAALDAQPLWLFQAFVAGGLLHVIVHHVPGGAAADGCGCPGGSAGGRSSSRTATWSGLGAIASLIGLAALHHGEAHPGHESFHRFTEALSNLWTAAAPWILIGFAAAGISQAFLPRFLFGWFRGRGRMSQALRGIALGLPLPICSCGVVPVYLSLLKKSVPPAAALAFLIATPEIGIDSFFLSQSLLGLEIAFIRLGMAFLVALGVAITLARTFERIEEEGELERLPLVEERLLPATLRGRLREAVRYGAVELVDHTGAWIVFGILVAAALAPLAAPAWLSEIPRGMDILVLSAIGLPLYVCASGGTPIAAVLLVKGVSVGAVLAFLITGPATNISTFGILRRYHGVRGAVLFAAAVYGFSIAIGFAINAVVPGPIPAPERVFTAPEQGHGLVFDASSLLLLLLMAASILRLGPRGFLAALTEGMKVPPGMAASRGAGHGGPNHAHDHEHDSGHSHTHSHGESH